MYEDNTIKINFSNGLFYFEYKDVKINESEAKKIIKQRLKLIRKHGDLNAICVVNKKTKILKKARIQFGMVRGYIGIKNIAIVMCKNSLVIKLLNLFSPKKRIDKKPLTKFFNNEEKAREWIASKMK